MNQNSTNTYINGKKLVFTVNISYVSTMQTYYKR